MPEPTPPPVTQPEPFHETVRQPPRPGETLPYAAPRPTRVESPDEGTPFGRYRLQRMLGRGGMGIVWQAWDSQLERTVALKQLLPEDGADADTVDRLLREARLAAKLQHPGIVAVHDAGEHEGTRFLTLDYIEGRSLHDVMSEPVPRERALGWVREIAEALHYAHGQGVIHRDIKPANVLIDAHGRSRVVDFGLAREIDPRAGAARTASGALVGTPLYMSPEQARGDAARIGPATDQFALGVVMYELLTSRTPFAEGDNLRDLLNAVVDGDPTPPRQIDPTISRDAETVCLKALEKDPARRYADLGKFAADVGRVLAGEPVHARPMSSLGRLARRAAGRRLVLVPVAVALLTVAGSGVWMWRAANARAARVTAALDRAKHAEAEARLEETQAALGEVLALDPTNEAAQAGLTRIASMRVELEDRKRTTQRLLEDAMPLVEQAAAELRNPRATFADLMRKVAKAEALVIQAARQAPESALAPYLLGRVRELQGRENDAIGCWDQAVKLDPDFGPAWYRSGRIYLEFSFFSSLAIPGAKGVINTDEARPLAGEVKRRFAAAFRTPWRRNSEEEALARDLARGLEAYVTGDFAGARRACREAIARAPEAEGIEDAHWLLGVTSAEPDALAELGEALARRPKFPLALYCRASLRSRAGDLAGARTDLDTAVEFNPGFNLAYANRAAVRVEQGDAAGAIADYTEALQIYPDMVLAWNARGSIRAEHGDLAGAAGDFTEAIRRSAQFAAPRANRGWVRVLQKDWPAAIADCTEAIRLDARMAAAYENRGEAHHALGQAEAAAADWLAEQAIDPKRAGSWNGLAVLAEEAGDRAGALELMGRGLAVNPRSYLLLNNRALMRWRGGDAAGALADLEQAREIDPGAWMPCYNLACFHAEISVGVGGSGSEPKPVSPEEAGRARDRAFEQLDRALGLGYADAAQLDADPDLAPLRGDPRWPALRAKLGK